MTFDSASYPLSAVTSCCDVVGLTVFACNVGAAVGTFTVTFERNLPLDGVTVPFAVTVFSSVGTAFTVTFESPTVLLLGVTVCAVVVGVTVFSDNIA